MKQDKRQELILYALNRTGYVSIESLSEEFGVSAQTIRRDLDFMDRNGLLERRPGGASSRTSILNSSYQSRQMEDLKEKERIARGIARFIPDNCSIFLTLGTTTEVVAEALLERSRLMVVTNNTLAALTLNRKPDFEVVLTSGYMRKSSHGLVGASCIDFVKGFQCDYLITSTGGINEGDGCLVDFHNTDVSVAQAMMANVDKVLLAVTPGKFGRRAVVKFAPLKKVNTLFTCEPVPDRLAELARNSGVEVVLC